MHCPFVTTHATKFSCPQTISSFIIPLNVQFTYFSVPFFPGGQYPYVGDFYLHPEETGHR